MENLHPSSAEARADERTRIDWSDISPDQQRALLAMADGWITGSRVWRVLFWTVTSVGAMAAAVYYSMEAFGLMNHTRQ
jgi:hypothetical protein